MTARDVAAALKQRFEAAGAIPVDLPLLLPAETLLDLYGEDIRGRAYVTTDAIRGEMMLRPDFTVPIVERHMKQGATPARYTYAGEIFRRQDTHPERPVEYLQVGYEVFDGADPVSADAEVFALFQQAVGPLGLRAITGDISILLAAVQGLKTSDARKSALLRHVWRPRRFRILLDRFGGRADWPKSRASMIAGDVAQDVPLTGLRRADEIAERLAAIQADASEPPISRTEMDGVAALLTVRETLPYVQQQLQDIAVDLPAISTAVARFGARIEALSKRGVDVEALEFEANYGRTSMEYYDGFVFGLLCAERPDLPPVASGGRYDALTRRLGQGQAIPAVGGVLRPGVIAELEASA